jgi:MFS family permease
MSTAMAMVTSEFPVKERGKMIGLVVSAVYLGLTLAPVIGGFLTQKYGWQSIFLINVIAGSFVIAATVFKVRVDWAEAADEMFDYKGSVLYMISVFAMMYGFSKLPDIYGIVLTTSGIICLVLFILIERKVINPVLDIKLFLHNRIFAFSNLAALINYAATFAITFMLSLYLQYVKDMEPRDAGLILITQPAVMAFTASLAGRLSDKIDSGILASVGMGIIVFGLILLCFIDADTEKLYLVGSLIIIGLGFGAFSTPNTNSVMSSVDKRFLGVASATQATMRLIGQILSMSLAAMIIHIFLGDAKITDSNEHLFMSASTIIFIIFAILCFIGIFASLARGKRSSAVQDN